MIALGIDIGTTSVKVILVSRRPNGTEVLCSSFLNHDADVQTQNEKFAEQDPSAVRHCLESCIKSLASKVGHDLVRQIEIISICGQMHGCMLWNTGVENIDFCQHSHLITWRDQRCDHEFLQSLPDPENCIPSSTGFGCATLFWLQRNKKDIIDGYNSAGTIMDYFVANLCKLEKPVMSTQNAMSWGFYNFCTEDWNVRILRESGFPIQLLPKISRPSDNIGKLKFDWCGIKVGTKVLIGLGDMQCSILSCNPTPSIAVFNLGTSAQLSVVSELESGNSFYKNNYCNTIKSRICVPYFGQQCVWTSASLNGGAVFDLFIQEMYQWTKRFSPNVTKEDIYSEIEKDSSEDLAVLTSMKIKPTIYGERHSPFLKASAECISGDDCKISRVAYGLAAGIIANVLHMYETGRSDNIADSVKEVWGCGTPFQRNRLFRIALKTITGLTCVYDKSSDAAFGAAIFASRH